MFLKWLWIGMAYCLFSSGVMAQKDSCYLVVKGSDASSRNSLNSIGQSLLSQYVIPIEPMPLSGISSNAKCVISLELLRQSDLQTVNMLSPMLNGSGNSKVDGNQGIQEAILNILWKAYPEHHRDFCEAYSSILNDQCGLMSTFSFSEWASSLWSHFSLNISWEQLIRDQIFLYLPLCVMLVLYYWSDSRKITLLLLLIVGMQFYNADFPFSVVALVATFFLFQKKYVWVSALVLVVDVLSQGNHDQWSFLLTGMFGGLILSSMTGRP
ncbi:MAG: hypothetical protein HQM12_17385 [SAR324 cluster bacterium]|nr:hypothetical protein [SAR324 cluster bacterium]